MKVGFILFISLSAYDIGETYLAEKMQPSGPRICEQLAQQIVGCTYYSFSTSDLLCKEFTGHPRKRVSGALVRIQKKNRHSRGNCPTASVIIQSRSKSTQCVKRRRKYASRGYHRVNIQHLTNAFSYKRHNQPLNWTSARDVCHSEGSDLISLNTKPKYDHIHSYLYRKYRNSYFYRLWVGMRRASTKTTSYEWLNGNGGFMKWVPNDPNYGNETCVILTPSGMADAHCYKINSFMCEKLFP